MKNIKVNYPSCPCCGYKLKDWDKLSRVEKFKEFFKDIYYFDGNNVEPKWLPFVVGLVGGTIIFGIISIFMPKNKYPCPVCKTFLEIGCRECPHCHCKLKWDKRKGLI